MRKQFSAQFKSKVALEAIKGEKDMNQISSLYEVHPTQIKEWRKIALEGMANIFTDKRKKEHKDQEQLLAELYETIGQRDMELKWLKKKIEGYSS